MKGKKKGRKTSNVLKEAEDDEKNWNDKNRKTLKVKYRIVERKGGSASRVEQEGKITNLYRET